VPIDTLAARATSRFVVAIEKSGGAGRAAAEFKFG
jgi:hypothetical protein